MKVDFPKPVAVIATYRRKAELERLLQTLASTGNVLAGCIVADNANEGTVAEICRSLPAAFPVHWIGLKTNRGPGAAWNAGMAEASERFGKKFDSFLILDDDVVVGAEELLPILECARDTGAALVAPLLEDVGGKLWGFPEPVDEGKRRAIRSCDTPKDAVQALSGNAHALCWATGACVLHRRESLRELGNFREDFFLLGEDLDLSMRVSNRFPAFFTTNSIVRHLPPPAPPSAAATGDLIKFCALLQNLGYLSFHVSHRHHMRRYLAGNFKRFLQPHLADVFRWRLALACFYFGVVKGRPAGTPEGESIRSLIQSAERKPN